MTNYQSKRGPLKSLALHVLNNPWLNPLAVTAAGLVLPSRLQRRIPVLGRTAKLSLPEGDILLRNIDRCQVAKNVFWSNGQLPSGSERLALSLATAFAKEAEVFLDIGAYTGLFALAAARANSRLTAHAYEILPENFLFLWQNVFANDLVERVRPHLVGIGSDRSNLTAPYSFGTGVLPSAVAIDSRSEGGVQVPIKPLDDIFSAFSGRMAWKIDVEGFEWDVFEGGTSLIERTRPDIVCEVLVGARDTDKIESFFKHLGYSMFHIQDDGLHASLHLTPSSKGRDWLFTARNGSHLAEAGWPVV